MVIADVFKRWHQLKGENAQLLTGTDEHGIKVQRAAEIAGADTYTFCSQHATQFKSLADAANISYDRFFRTTDSDHKEAVSHFWHELNRQGFIYEAKHEGWYCVSDETFYPESQVQLILDPATGEKLMASIETGKEVLWTSETNYHFRLSHFRDRLLEHYKQNPKFIMPENRMNFIIREVASGLKDLSISRPKERLSWGIPVPDDPSQTIYVWFDALVNYLTYTGYPYTAPGAPSAWPADVQVIGKDIVRFHTIYWPAFLMALNLPLPTNFLCHAHWTMNTQKMSKSLGNVVNPFAAMKRFGVDTVRYYMVRDGGFADDAPYENTYIVKRYKDELHNKLGGLLVRLTRSKFWNVSECIDYCRQRIQDESSKLPPMYSEFRQSLSNAVMESDKQMQQLNVRLATEVAVKVFWDANKAFDMSQAWIKAKGKGDDLPDEVKWAVFEACESLRVAMILLQPFMPERMAYGLDVLGVPQEARNWHPDLARNIPSYGKAYVQWEQGPRSTLFPPLLSEH